MNLRSAVFATLLLNFAFVQAGEIVILQPASKDSRSEKGAARSAEMARQRSGKPPGPIIVEDGVVDSGSKAQRSNQEAQEYLRSGSTPSPGDEKTTIILRSVPLSDAEKSRQRAAYYVQPPNSSANNRACGDVSLSIGTVGDKTMVERNVTVNERGNSAVNVNCRK